MQRITAKLFTTTLLLVSFSVSVAFADHPATTEDQIKSLTNMCSETASDRTDRQASESLYDRLGGYDRILELTREIVRRHEQNPVIIPMLENVDSENLARHVADFVAAGTGGTTKYTGRSLPASHAHLKLTDADFLSAGGDIVSSMQHLGYGQNEIDEFMCIMLSLKDQVVFK